MSLNNVTPGKNAPEAFNVVIEIPMNADPIKYEVDKESGAIFVDRFMTTAMHYPTNYGYVPQTLSGDGDPVDVLVITPYPLHPGVVVPCRPLGILMMEDEAGVDGKVIAVPTSKILPMYDHWKTIDDVNAMRRNAIALCFVGVAVNIGMWLERFVIIVLSLEHDHLPVNWNYYAFSPFDYLLLIGSFGMFFTQFLLFTRVAPVVSIAEVKATLLHRPTAAAHGGKDHAHG